jgi:hypothetical protein
MSGRVPASPLSVSQAFRFPETGRHLQPDRTIRYRMAKWAQSCARNAVSKYFV